MEPLPVALKRLQTEEAEARAVRSAALRSQAKAVVAVAEELANNTRACLGLERAGGLYRLHCQPNCCVNRNLSSHCHQ